MRKLYSLVLLAVGLLIGTNAWADGVIEIVRGGAVLPTTYNHLKDAFAAAQDGDILQLTDDMNESEAKAAWLGAPSSGTLDDYASPDSENPLNGYRSITLDLKGHTYYNSAARYVIALTRGKLRITSTGGEGEIRLQKHGIAVFGTYLKIDAKTQTPFSHLIIDENVKITEGEKGVVLEVLNPYAAKSNVKWADTYSLDYRCDIFPNSNWGIANGARIDIYGKVETTEYACQVSGNVRSALEYLNSDGTYRTTYYTYPSSGNSVVIHFPLYWKKSDTELYLPGTNSPDSKEKEDVAKAWSTTAYYDAVVSSSNDYVLTLNDNNYAAYVHIRPTAKLKTNDEDSKTAIGFYSAGYSRVYIEGTCEGSTGLYVKSGDVELHDATITSNYSGDYVYAHPTTTGVEAGGSAIVIESNASYTGNIDATVSGDTKATGSSGYAIEESVTNAEGTEVDAITITGGTFVGGGEGTMKLDEKTVAATSDSEDPTIITIVGGKIDGNNTQTTIQVGDDEIPLTDFLADTQNTNTHITYVTDENNKTTMVISEGPAPSEDPDNVGNTTWAFIASQSNSANPPSYAWTAVEQNQQISSGTIYLGELQIISGSENNLQELTINSGATLQVDHLIMNDYARIIVEAGGKLIVKGTQGIVAPQVENIVLKASETEQALFLFHPEVSSNKYPNATVEFKSKAYLNGSKGVFQRFGVPTWNREDKTTSMKTASGTAKTWITQYDYVADDWAAWTPYETATDIVIVNALPFRGYMLYSNNDKDHKKDYTFEGNLIGNQNENLHMYYGWNYFANSYTAPISIKDFINTVMASLDADKQDYVLGTVYLYTNSGDDDYTWTGINLATPASSFQIVDNQAVEVENQLTIQPMQAFLMRLNLIDGEMDQPISYKYDVYNPNMGIANNNQYLAPARSAQANNEMHVLVSGEGSWDKVYVVENNNFSNDFENGYDAYKYDGKTGVNLYAMNSDARMEILATDDAEGTFLGIDAPKAGNYTLHVAGVEGMEYAIVDMETNAVINAVNGTKYQFYANAGANDYRFQVVKAAKIPTAIENTEAVKSAKGVYTLTGQFLGNDVNALPAGVYIVNGVKVVK